MGLLLVESVQGVETEVTNFHHEASINEALGRAKSAMRPNVRVQETHSLKLQKNWQVISW